MFSTKIMNVHRSHEQLCSSTEWNIGNSVRGTSKFDAIIKSINDLDQFPRSQALTRAGTTGDRTDSQHRFKRTLQYSILSRNAFKKQ